MADKVSLLLKRGQFKNLPAQGSFANGTLYFTTDEGGLYLGVDGGKGVRMQGSVLYFETLQEFYDKVTPPYSTNVLYFIEKNLSSDGSYQVFNALMRWDGSKWVQINATADAFQNALDRIGDVEDLAEDNSGRLDVLEGYVGEPNEGDTETLFSKAYALRADVDDLVAMLGEPANGQSAKDLFKQVAENAANIAANAEAIRLNGEAIGDLEDADAAFTLEINGIKETLGTKAAASDLTDLAGRVTKNEGDIKTINDTLPSLAKQSDLNTLSGTVGDINDRTTALEGKVGTATDGADKDTLFGKVADHTTQLSNLDKAVSDNAKDIENNESRIDAIEAALGTGGSANNALLTRVDTLESDVADIKELNAQQGEAISKNTQDIATNTGNIATNTGNIAKNTQDIATNADNIATNTGNIAKNAEDIAKNGKAIKDVEDRVKVIEDTYATDEELLAAKNELKTQLDSHILAANAMRYMGVVVDEAALNQKVTENGGASIGDTYVASGPFKLTSGTQVYAGDLLIAEGTENADTGKITGTITWTVVDTGYIEAHENRLEVDSDTGAINLMSHLSEVLSSIKIASVSENVTVAFDEGAQAININMVWGEF